MTSSGSLLGWCDVWNQPRQLTLDDEDFPRAEPLWRSEGAVVVDCWPDAVGVADGETGHHLLWRAADGEFDAQKCWLLDARLGWFARPGGEDEGRRPLREIWPLLDDTEAQAAVAGVALAAWHAGSGFCPVCGGPTVVDVGGWSRRCPGCSAQHFPRIDPAIIVALVDDRDRLLLGSQPTWGKRRSVFAGYVMAGESLEQAVHREVAEEVGLAIDHVSYFGSQPWPFPRSLMVAFTAHVADPDALHVDGHEIVQADWFTRDEARQAWADGSVDPPHPMSIAHRMIEAWLAGERS